MARRSPDESADPRITVVIPARNAAATLGDAVESALAQTLPPAEVLIVDDQSTDETPAVAREFAGRVRLLPGPGRGPGPARNVGIQVASSPFVAFLDADDLWVPTALERLHGALRSRPEAGLAYGDVLLEGEEPSWLERKQLAGSGPVYPQLLQECFILTSAVMAPRRVLLEAGLFDETASVVRGAEDWDLWLRIARIRSLVRVDGIVTRRRLLPGALSADHFELVRSRTYVLRKHARLNRGGPVERLVERELGRWLMLLGQKHFDRREFREAGAALREAAARIPLPFRARFQRAVCSLPAPLARRAARAGAIRSALRRKSVPRAAA